MAENLRLSERDEKRFHARHLHAAGAWRTIGAVKYLYPRRRKIGFEFSYSWNMEHDLDIMTRKGKVINIGEAEVALMAI